MYKEMILIREILLQKNGFVVSLLAKEFLALEVGDKIKTIRSYAEEFSVGHGTVQLAFKKLIDINAVDIEKKGYKGSFLASINYEVLIELAGINSLAGIMPLPSSKKYEGLATGLFEVLNQGVLNTNLMFMTGAKSRIESLIQGRNHFAIISKNSYNYYRNEYPDLKLVEEFGDKTFISGHILIHRKDIELATNVIRMGIDKSSYDQMSITEKYIKKNKLNVTLVDLRYSSIVNSILSKRIDAVIWSKDNLKYRIDGIIEKELDCPMEELDITNACLVMIGGNNHLLKYLRKNIAVEKVVQIQKEVINERRPANY